ncbi:hypothetical protein J1N35_035117 [Gossypium stocksii]|uniref:Reverse transcriptase domain-containing protein n=1 Tax=Gossypium stocksii TaxID=47602 RepID=A0A9D3ZR65_9ROSI|nr:hypothetical protein J1N35_035117 [Gossypium stocksii]
MDDTDPSVGGNIQSLASDHVKEGFSNFINNQEQHMVHFNPTFEGSSTINVAVKKGVLEDKNHSAVVFKHSSMLESGSEVSRGSVCISENELPGGVSNGQNFNFKASNSKGGWRLNKTRKGPSTCFKNSDNSRGCASDKFLRVFREYSNLHKPDVISLLEPRISGFKADTIITKLGWEKSHRVEAVGFSGGIWIGWKSSVDLGVVVNHPQFILDLYRENPGPSRPLPPNAFLRISSKDVDFLGKGITNGEIKSALFDMAPLKAPGSDGFQAAFFQNQWDNIGRGIYEWVKKVFEEGIIDPEFNNTLIVLIPKVPNPENFSQFRPISLSSVLYKLVMKIIANRFKSIFPKIIGQEQAGFIAGRSIIDNVIIAQEVLHSMRAKK